MNLDGLELLFRMMLVISVVLGPLGAWKLIELIVHAIQHLHWQ